MTTIITNEAKTLEQMEAHITGLTKQCVIDSVAKAVDSDLPVDVVGIKKRVDDMIKQALSTNNELIKNEKQFIPVDTGKLAMSPNTDGVFELSETIGTKTIAGL